MASPIEAFSQRPQWLLFWVTTPCTAVSYAHATDSHSHTNTRTRVPAQLYTCHHMCTCMCEHMNAHTACGTIGDVKKNKGDNAIGVECVDVAVAAVDSIARILIPACGERCPTPSLITRILIPACGERCPAPIFKPACGERCLEPQLNPQASLRREVP